MLCGRSPLGLRGLKFVLTDLPRTSPQSQPSWAAWIEILPTSVNLLFQSRRSPLGLRGLKSFLRFMVRVNVRRSPLGLRGLK